MLFGATEYTPMYSCVYAHISGEADEREHAGYKKNIQYMTQRVDLGSRLVPFLLDILEGLIEYLPSLQ